MNQVRIFRIAENPWRVEYGWWHQVGQQRRFKAVRSWPAGDKLQAEQLAERMKIDHLLSDDLAAPDVPPLEQGNLARRKLSQAPGEPGKLLKRAMKGLAQPLPSVEESHRKLKAELPRHNKGAYQFYVYLNDVIYQRLVAMAVAAGTNRNRIIEALILALDEEAPAS